MAFENSAMLVKLQIGRWTGKIDDKAAEREIANAHSVTGTYGDVRKDLIDKNAFQPIVSAESAIRAFHNIHTQPWASGVHILPAALYFTYMQGMGKAVDAFKMASDSFIQQYPVLRSDAKVRLGTKYVESEYPSAEDLKNKFYASIDVIPLANTQSIVLDLTSSAISDIQKSYASTLSKMEQKSVQASWTVLTTALDNFIERLKNPESARLNTVSKLSDTAELLKKMNVMQSEALDSICDDVALLLCGSPMLDLKNDTLVLQETLTHAEEVRKKIDLFKPL